MGKLAILELEEGTLNLVVGERVGASVTLLRSLRLKAPDLGRDALTAVLRSIPAGVLHDVHGVHVVLGERRFQHFVSTVPRLRSAEILGFVQREALRLTGQTTAADVLVATRLSRVLGGDRFRLASVALARSVWEPIGQALAAASLPVLSVHSMETCLALGAPSTAEPVAVLECNAGRARFVLIDDGCPLQVRRFLVSGAGDANEGALVAQLAMELPRTLDWLRETGLPLPRTLVLGSRVPIEGEALGMLCSEELPNLVRAGLPFAVADGDVVPGLGVAMLLRRLAAGGAPPSLLAPAELQLPRSLTLWAAMAGSVLAGVGLAAAGVTQFAARADLRVQVEAQRELGDGLAAALALDAAAAPTPDAAQSRLERALRMRRPVSRLLAQVSNAAEPGLQLDRLDFASTDRIVVTGLVQGRTRQLALANLGSFGKRLRDLPYLQSDGPDEVGEVEGQPSSYRFKMSFVWRSQ